MKNKTTIYTITFLLLVLSLYGFKSITVPSGSFTSVAIGVNFGSRSTGNGCFGRGACAVETITAKSSESYEATGTAYLNFENKLVIELDKHSISLSRAESQFVSQEFKLEEDFQLEGEIVTALGLKTATLSLEKGGYPIEETSEKIIIAF